MSVARSTNVRKLSVTICGDIQHSTHDTLGAGQPVCSRLAWKFVIVRWVQTEWRTSEGAINMIDMVHLCDCCETVGLDIYAICFTLRLCGHTCVFSVWPSSSEFDCVVSVNLALRQFASFAWLYHCVERSASFSRPYDYAKRRHQGREQNLPCQRLQTILLRDSVAVLSVWIRICATNAYGYTPNNKQRLASW